MESSGNIKYRFDAKIGGYVVVIVIANATNRGVEIPSVYDDGIHGERPVTEIRRRGQIVNYFVYMNIPKSVKKIGFDVYQYCMAGMIFVDDENPNY